MATWMKFLYMIMGFMKSKSNRKSNNKKMKKKLEIIERIGFGFRELGI